MLCGGSVNLSVSFKSLLIAFGVALAVPGSASENLEYFLARSAEQLQAGQNRLALDQLLLNEARYSGNPEYDYLLGLAALACDENTLALHAFERVTLQNPKHAGAWIDLAIANVRLGDYQTAHGLLAFVEETFSPPAALRQQIQQVRQQLEARKLAEERAAAEAKQRANSVWRGEAWIQAGHTNNANSGVTINGVTLTPAGSDPVYLPIDPSRKPRSDTFLQWRGILQRTQVLDPNNELSGVGEWVLQARDKTFASTSGYGAQDIGVAYSQDRPASLSWAESARLVWGSGWQSYQFGGARLLDSFLVHAGVKQPLNEYCSALLRTEVEQRNYAKTGYADANLQWLNGRFYCGKGSTAIVLGLRVGEDQAQTVRAGGNSIRREATLDVLHALSPSLVAEGSVMLGTAEDQQGYSPLMANNRTRYNQKTNWRLALNWAIEQQLTLVGSIEEYKEESNMALFNFAERQLLIGLRYGF